MIYYIGYYSCDIIREEQRIAAPATINKMGYIISVLSEREGNAAMVVSPAETELGRYTRGSLHQLHEGVTLRTFDSIRGKHKLLRFLGHALTKKQMLGFLRKNVGKDDTLIVYHSLALMKCVKKIKSAKKCKLIIEVEELYSDVKENETLRKKEIDYLQIADGYIVITELLNKEINLENKPSVVSHGTYRVVPDYGDKRNDGKIHVVYAGSFNPVKGGACTAVEAAASLDDNYVLHILGKGIDAHRAIVLQKIEQIARTSLCEIRFDGYKTGVEFDRFIQSCHIGLSTQQPDGKYNASSFPSKVLMYMSNGLPVVSVKIPAVASSSVGAYISYYDEPRPEKIAEAIMAVSREERKDVREKLRELDTAFGQALSLLLEGSSL